MVRSWLMSSTGRDGAPLDCDAEELLSHEQHVPRADVRLAGDANEGAVRAPEIGQKDSLAVPRPAAVQPRDVAVFGKEDVATLAAEVDAALRNRKRVAGLLAADDERDSPHV